MDPNRKYSSSQCHHEQTLEVLEDDSSGECYCTTCGMVLTNYGKPGFLKFMIQHKMDDTNYFFEHGKWPNRGKYHLLVK